MATELAKSEPTATVMAKSLADIFEKLLRPAIRVRAMMAAKTARNEISTMRRCWGVVVSQSFHIPGVGLGFRAGENVPVLARDLKPYPWMM